MIPTWLLSIILVVLVLLAVSLRRALARRSREGIERRKKQRAEEVDQVAPK